MQKKSFRDWSRQAFARRKKKHPLLWVVAIGIALVVGFWIPTHTVVAITPSLDRNIFYLETSPDLQTVDQGDYLVFSMDYPWEIDGHGTEKKITKMVGCRGGQTLQVTVEREYFCDGKMLGQALETDSEGRKLPQFVFNGPLPEGKFFMVGHHSRSYDSKYFGLIGQEEIYGQAHPVTF